MTKPGATAFDRLAYSGSKPSDSKGLARHGCPCAGRGTASTGRKTLPIKTLPIRQTCDPSEPNSPSGMIAGTRRVTVMTGDDGRRAILRLPGLGILSSALVRSPHHLHGVLDVA